MADAARCRHDQRMRTNALETLDMTTSATLVAARLERERQTVQTSLESRLRAYLDQAARRERALAETIDRERARLSATLLQRGLFDRRAERASAAQRRGTGRGAPPVSHSPRRARGHRTDRCSARPPRVRPHPTMIPGVYGRLLTASFIRDVFPTLPGISAPPPAWSRRLADCARRIEAYARRRFERARHHRCGAAAASSICSA